MALMVVVVSWVLFAIAFLFVVCRVYTRVFILHCLGPDDCLTVASIILILLYTAFVTQAAKYGLGKTVAAVGSLDDYAEAMKWEIISQAVCIFNIITSKCAVAMFLLRIVIVQWHRAMIWAAVAVTTILTTFATIICIMQCVPVEATWDPRLRATATCWINFKAVGITTSSWSIVIDFALAILPCFVIWGLQMKRKDKIVVTTGLGFGVFAGISGIVRTVELGSLDATEYLYDTVNMLIWSSVEVTVTTICASIPVLRALYVQLRYKGEGTSGASTNSSAGPMPRSLGGLRTQRSRNLSYALDNDGQTPQKCEQCIHDSKSDKWGYKSSVFSSDDDNILGDHRGLSHMPGQIRRTHAVQVSYSAQEVDSIV